MRWTGRPAAGGSFWRTAPIWLMGIPWTAFSGAMFAALVAAVIAGPPADRVVPTWEFVAVAVAIIFVGAFLLIGLGMVGAPFWVWWKSRRTLFVVTDRRLVRMTLGATREVKSYDLAKIISTDRRAKRDGSGTLMVVTRVYKDSDGDTARDTEMLVGVANVAAADRLIRDGMRTTD